MGQLARALIHHFGVGDTDVVLIYGTKEQISAAIAFLDEGQCPRAVLIYTQWVNALAAME